MARSAIWATHQLTIVLAVVQIAFLVILALFGTHAPAALPGGTPTVVHQVNYTDFQDVHVVLIVGFGFLVAFLRRYGFASFGLSLLLAALTIQWALIVRGLISIEFQDAGKFHVTIANLIQADFTAIVVLVSFGALVGKLSPIQYIVLAILEVPASLASEWLVLRKLEVQDVGGAVVVHVFGAVFGIVVSRILYKKQWQQSDDADSVYHSEVISFIGVAFLWLFWPSLNAVATTGDARQRAIVNTYVAIATSTIASFLASQFINKKHQFNARQAINAAIAGGVALGASANILLEPFHAALVGVVSGLAAIGAFQTITPKLNAKGAHDTRGVFAVHGIPAILSVFAGIIGSLASVIFLACYQNNSFPESQKILGKERNNAKQAGAQLVGLIAAIIVAAITAAITGIILKLKIWAFVNDQAIFSDTGIFDVPEDYEFTTRVVSHIDKVQLQEQIPIGGVSSTSKEIIPVPGAGPVVSVDETEKLTAPGATDATPVEA